MKLHHVITFQMLHHAVTFHENCYLVTVTALKHFVLIFSLIFYPTDRLLILLFLDFLTHHFYKTLLYLIGFIFFIMCWTFPPPHPPRATLTAQGTIHTAPGTIHTARGTILTD